jgi:uncharacterized membrane protein
MKRVIYWTVATLLCAAVTALAFIAYAYWVAASFLVLSVMSLWSAIDEWIDYRLYRKHRSDVIRINPPPFPDQPKRGIR